MHRFAIFGDGSNLFGALKSMNLEADDYVALYGYVFRESHSQWTSVTHQTEKSGSELRRVYWYAVGSIDDWDLTTPQSQTALRNAFSRDKDVRDSWLAMAGKANPGLLGAKLEDKAWAACFNLKNALFGRIYARRMRGAPIFRPSQREASGSPMTKSRSVSR